MSTNERDMDPINAAIARRKKQLSNLLNLLNKVYDAEKGFIKAGEDYEEEQIKLAEIQAGVDDDSVQGKATVMYKKKKLWRKALQALQVGMDIAKKEFGFRNRKKLSILSSEIKRLKKVLNS